MSETIYERVYRAIQGILRDHLEVLVVLLAESGMDASEQRERVELLVGMLDSVQFEKRLCERGRDVPLQFVWDPTGQPGAVPELRLNEQLLGRVDEQEIFSVLSRPVASLLGLSSVVVGLVFREQDARQLKMLALSVAQGLEVPAVRLTAIRSWVSGRVELFLARLRAVIDLVAVRPPEDVGSADVLIAQLMASAEQWPQWFDVEDLPYIQALVGWADRALVGAEDMPPAQLLVEICWEGTALSVQSFLRHAARVLRGYSGSIDRKSMLHILAHAVTSTHKSSSSVQLSDWPGLSELEQAWKELWVREQMLAGGRNADSQAPELSVFDAPGLAMRLSEPETLPWELPLLCWTTREYEALRDLLLGMTRSLNCLAWMNESTSEFVFSAQTPVSSGLLMNGDFRVQMQPVRSNWSKDLRQNDGELGEQKRAFGASFSAMRQQFAELDEGSKQRVNNVLFSAYSGYLPQARAVWQRRFSGIRELEPGVAFERLALEFNKILRLPIILDPFDTPLENELLAMPALSLVVAFSEKANAHNSLDRYEQAVVRVPMSAWKSLLGNVPIRLRVVGVPLDSSGDCTWLCDRELTLRDLNSQPLENLLRAVHNDMLYLSVFP